MAKKAKRIVTAEAVNIRDAMHWIACGTYREMLQHGGFDQETIDTFIAATTRGLKERLRELKEVKTCTCNDTRRLSCHATNPDGFTCSRVSGHRGEHVACGIDTHRIAVWPQKEKP